MISEEIILHSFHVIDMFKRWRSKSQNIYCGFDTSTENKCVDSEKGWTIRRHVLVDIWSHYRC